MIGCRNTAGPDCKNVELIQPNGPECQPICRVCRDEKPVTTRPIRPTKPVRPTRPTPPAVDPREVSHIHVHVYELTFDTSSWQLFQHYAEIKTRVSVIGLKQSP